MAELATWTKWMLEIGECMFSGDPNNPTEFKCESCDKVFKFIDSYWKHAKKCGRESIGGGVGSKKLSAEQQQMMVTLKGEDTKNTCSNCGRDFFHEVGSKS